MTPVAVRKAGSEERGRTLPVRWVVAGGVVVLALLLAGVVAVASARGEEEPRVPGVDSADAGFARDMAVHHQQAVEMSFTVRDRTDDKDVRRLAYDIANTQANQRGMLLGWLDLWQLPKVAPDGAGPMAWMENEGGHGDHEAGSAAAMPGMASEEELVRLGSLRGEEAEVFYLQLMTDHHQGGVPMAEACASLCAVPAEKRLAAGMVEGQQSELRLMRDMLADRGAKRRT